ncbi:MAG TPA: D-alanyl-D-alanine carboxypeptidase, partial [Candidatus Eremiobacteraceae bacterium]|nr:D-alanyl-D-alanine carboxypeptidase [Candidatus Eremiobacteraceae bacterium]
MFRDFVAIGVLCAAMALPTPGLAVPAPPMSQSRPFSTAQIVLLRSLVDGLAGRPQLKGSRIGVSVVQASTGRVVVAREPDGEFAPASNFKLLDAAAALAYLGSHNRFV